MFLSGSCPARIALSGRRQKTSRNPTLVAQQSISYFIVVMLSRVVLDLSIFHFTNMTVGCVLCTNIPDVVGDGDDNHYEWQ